MRIYRLTLALTIVFNSVYGQDLIQGYIFDNQTSNPLPYATLGALKQQYGAYSDTSGLYKLYYKDENKNDSLKISYLGYTTILTTINDLKQNPNIFLEPNKIQLKEVVVKPNKKNRTNLELGYFVKKKQKGKPYTLPPNSLTHATYIPFPKNGGEIILKSVNFRYMLLEENSPLRLRILNVDNKGVPGEDILVDNVIFNDFKKKKENVANIDISKYNILMPTDGVFVALEIIDTKYKLDEKRLRFGPAIGHRRGDKISLSRWSQRFNDDRWGENPDLPFTFTIGLTVINYTD